MILHHLFGTQLRRLGHGNLMVIPGGGHHPGRPVLRGPHGPGHHIAHGVDHPHPELCRPVGGDFHRLRHEFRLRGHNGLTGAALGQLIPGPLLPVRVGDVGNHQLLHHPLDEGGLPRPDRAHHAHINISAGSGCNLLINGFFHRHPASFSLGRRALLPWCSTGYVRQGRVRTRSGVRFPWTIATVKLSVTRTGQLHFFFQIYLSPGAAVRHAPGLCWVLFAV